MKVATHPEYIAKHQRRTSAKRKLAERRNARLRKRHGPRSILKDTSGVKHSASYRLVAVEEAGKTKVVEQTIVEPRESPIPSLLKSIREKLASAMELLNRKSA